ncbi:Zinc finger, CW-type [Ostreococcus tauri]|uniref:Zinc finger, CW-type n=1 Tax=Ostreococcus tauri TaxID=70448 RepID=A0A090M5T3_OSTTA|nr:Zinc finger, CW-type [Ostreococcus tauri]CEF99605.1 Zinc finger, CW-type [Ostreococcus tauri]|eukprot:XP_022839927.1 Zinc finger, CW-type [Ostreococcus tauri]
MARETLCDGAPSPAARSLRDRARLRPSVTMRASLEGDAIGSIAHVKRASLREEVERRANVELGVVSDVDEAWRRMSAAPRRGADAARESWLQCERCDRWRRVPRCVETALGEKGTFVCGDGRDGRFNACRRSQEATDREINAMFDDALKANDETRARIRKELINERVKMTQKRKRLDDLRQREARGEIELHEDGTYTKLVKKSKNGKNGAAASSGSAPPHPGPFDEYGWVQCETDGCGKWRKVAYTVSEELASSYRERFVCAMNADKAHASCSAPQELADEEIDDFNRDQGIRKILHQKAVQDHYAHFANGKGPVPNGLVCVSVKLEDKPKPKPKPIIDEAVPSAPIEEGPEDPVDWVPGTPRPYPTPASIGTIPVQVPVTCNSHRGVYLPRRNIFRCYCEQPEHMCANVTGQGDGNMFYGSAWEAHCGRGATRKYKASVRVYLAGPTPQMFIGRWFDHVGLKVVDRGGGGGGGSAKPKKAKSLTKNVIIEVDESFVPGPINQLSLRNLMTVFGFILDGTATGEVKREGDTSEGREKVKEKIKEEKQKTAEELREEVEKELGRLSVVCKSFKIAALTVLKAAGVKKAEKKNADGTALRTQFTVIEEYVDRKDELECQIERSVTLAKNHPYVKGSTTSTANVDDGHPPGWWPSLGVKAERKKLVTEVIEQETYGCDFVTGRDATTTLQKVLPDFSEDDVWALYKHLLSQVNESYGAMTPDTLATQSLALAAEDLAEKFENQGVRMNDMKSIAFSKALWKLASESRVSPEFYAVHRKGFGVVCKEPIKKGEFLIDFLGEIYPPWAWAEKQDAIRLVQKNRGLRDKGPPEFYNMQIERPGGDEEGYSVLFCDAMHENNYAGRLSHTCDPNVEVNLKAINGKYEIHFITNRDIEPGEELAYNYHSCTDNMKEVEAAFCLCGARMCRGSYLNFVGEDNNSQVLNTKHKLIDRQVIAFKAIDRAAEPLNPKQVRCLEQVGFYPGKGLLKCCPSWLLHFVGDLAIYMEEEVNQLPKHILAAAKQEHEKLLLKSPGMEFTYNEKFAKIDALAVRENRTQSIAIMLSKLRRVLTRARDGGAQKSVYECLDKFESAPPPFVRLTDDEVAVQFWGTGTDGFDRSVIRGLLNAMGPHERKRDADEFVKWTSKVEAIADKARKGKMDLRESLLWLRDELIKLPRDKCARHDLAAALVHFYAMTEQFWQPSPAPEHMGYTSDKVAVREDEVNAWGVGAGGGGDKIVARVEKTYRPGYSGATMLQWHKQEVADPTQHLVANRKGNLTMPDIACCYSSRPNQPLARAGSLEHETWIGHLQNWPEETWPNLSGPWGIGNPQKLIGSPIIDAWMQGKRSIPVKVLAWIKANVRPP